MTLLLLMRHAKAVPAEQGMADFDRPLADRGRADARRMGEALRKRWGEPARVLCSPSRRTRETLAALDIKAAPEFLDSLYEGALSDYLAPLADAPAFLLLVGHNPTVHAATFMLAGDGPEAVPLRNGFPTGSLAALRSEHSGARAWRLDAFLRPADLASA